MRPETTIFFSNLKSTYHTYIFEFIHVETDVINLSRIEYRNYTGKILCFVNVCANISNNSLLNISLQSKLDALFKKYLLKIGTFFQRVEMDQMK